MAADRQKRNPITMGHRVQAALIAGISVTIPDQIILYTSGAIADDTGISFSFTVGTLLGAFGLQTIMMSLLFFPAGWLVERVLTSKSLWFGYPFVMAGTALALLLEILAWLGWGQLSEFWYLGLLAIIGAHAGWRYYSWLCDEREITA